MDATLATVADDGQAIVDINREAGRNKLISRLIYYLILNPSMVALAKPFHRGPRGWVMFLHTYHAPGGANGSIMGMFAGCVFC